VPRRVKRDTYNYTLRDGRKTVYHGITIDPDRRYKEHESSRKRFTMMTWGVPVSHDRALERERDHIEGYKNNQGRKPRYNKI